MDNLIAAVIFCISLIGIGIIIFRKVPVLVKMPVPKREIGTVGRITSGVQNSRAAKGLSFDILLQKILSRFRVLTLRTEHRTSNWLTSLRQRSLEKKKKLSEDYWHKIKRKK